MRQIDIGKRSVCDAMNIVRYLEKRELIANKPAKAMKKDILDTNTDFVSIDKDMTYWNECQKAHEFGEITDADLLSVVNV